MELMAAVFLPEFLEKRGRSEGSTVGDFGRGSDAPLFIF
jgi:hypothetical protein